MKQTTRPRRLVGKCNELSVYIRTVRSAGEIRHDIRCATNHAKSRERREKTSGEENERTRKNAVTNHVHPLI